ncbi:MAG: MMPL family transporter [Xanthomonadales bacterium]|nr:MMPL family transporter [Xanthomonadales bacterium]
MSKSLPNKGFGYAMERMIFGARMPLLFIFTVVTMVMVFFAAQLRVDAGFKKQLPLEHEYMQTFLDYEDSFGGANRLLVAVMAKDGDMFDAEFFKAFEQVTNEVFFIDGVNRAGVRSIFTPNVRFVEIVEGGFAGGNVIPANFAPSSEDFDPSQEDFDRIRANIVKSGQLGRLVAEDFSGAMVWADLLEVNPQTGEKIDYQRVAADLEQIRQDFESEQLDVHIIGFAKIVGDIAEGAKSVIYFFGIAILITAILLFLYSGSFALTILPLICSIVAVIWQLGTLSLLGYGIDPMNILTPFLIFAIGVSHGVQMITSWNNEFLFGEAEATDPNEAHGVSSMRAARRTFRRLLAPGTIALLSDTVGFLTILFIDIRIIRELATTASIGVALIIFTNLILLPLLLSLIRVKNISAWRESHIKRTHGRDALWRALAGFTKMPVAILTIVIAGGLFVFGLDKGDEMQIGDSQAGVPELRPDARYNQDAEVISSEFSLGVDAINIIAEAPMQACTEDYEAMENIDRFAWHILNVEGVQQVITLPWVAKVINAGWNEGNINWRVLPRNNFVMRQNLQNIETDTGLLNRDCDAMPVIAFTEDHKASTINRVVSAVKDYRRQYGAGTETEVPADLLNQLADPGKTRLDYTPVPKDQLEPGQVNFRLATGNVGVMAATNEVVEAAQFPMLVLVYAVIIVLCVITFRSLRGTICIVLPLALVSVLAYALMAYLGIGLKVNTLPVVALGVGIGVDYGIYIFSRLQYCLKEEGMSLEEAYFHALKQTGKPVIFTAFTLAIGVGTWIFSTLQFQADMGKLLAFMFFLNMVGAVLILPALARVLLRPREKADA